MNDTVDVGADSRVNRQFRAFGHGVIVCIGGLIAGLLGMIVIGIVLPDWVYETTAGKLLRGNQIQLGFACFAGAYLYGRSNRERFVRIRSPALSDLVWIGVLAPLVFLIGELFTNLLATMGVSHPTPGTGENVEWLHRPSLWLVIIGGQYLLAAPAEELVYRGIIHGLLRKQFDTIGVVGLGALLFGVLHVLVGLLTPAVGLMGSLHWGLTALVPGVLWGYAYERTDNLFVPSILHALSWTIADLHWMIPLDLLAGLS